MKKRMFNYLMQGMKHWDLVILLQTLAMVSFFCANNSAEKQPAMQIFWEIVLPKSNSTSDNKHVSPVIITTAISAWSFLITTVVGWELTYNHWQGYLFIYTSIFF
jgi:hypothetical protein